MRKRPLSLFKKISWTLFLAISFILSCHCSSADTSVLGTVKQINIGNKSAAIALGKSKQIEVGDSLVITSHEGQQCDLKIEEIDNKNNIAIVNTSKCSFGNDIRVGQVVEKSLLSNKNFQTDDKEVAEADGVEQEQAKEEVRSEESKDKEEKKESEKDEATRPKAWIDRVREDGWMFGVGLSYGADPKLKFDKGTASSSTKTLTANTFSVALELEKVISFDFDVRRMKNNSFGFIGGITVDSARKVYGGTITIGGVKTDFTSGANADAFKTSLINANISYLWDLSYLFLGINASSIDIGEGPVKATGGIGSQFGIGGYFGHNKIVSEIFVRAVAIGLKGTSNEVFLDFGKSYMTTVQFGLKYIF